MSPLTNKKFKDQIIEKFGTAEKLGLHQRDHYTGETEEEFTASGESREFEGQEVLPNGKPHFICTNSALYAVEQMGEGLVYGFYTDNNPEATHDEILGAGGHDFAVFRDRFIVDLWISHYTGSTDKVIYDMKDPKDRSEIIEIFGNPKNWEPVSELPQGKTKEDVKLVLPPLTSQIPLQSLSL
jgi:hypothetical protein